MTKPEAWIVAARLRTLPLSVSGIIAAAAAAKESGMFSAVIFVLALATTLGLQILSNFANEYGDWVKGTDNEDRIGPIRGLQSGALSVKEFKTGIGITAAITFLLACLLIFIVFKNQNLFHSTVFLLLGIASIIAAVTYTVGSVAYGYKALGDVFVFVFFGLVSVLGAYFLFTKSLDNYIFLQAVVIGLLSTAVLNLNNMRDRKADAKAGKNTLAVLLGRKNVKVYHYLLIGLAFGCAVLYVILRENSGYQYLELLAFIPLFFHLKKVRQTKHAELLDPELKKIALSTFLYSLLFFASVWF